MWRSVVWMFSEVHYIEYRDIGLIVTYVFDSCCWLSLSNYLNLVVWLTIALQTKPSSEEQTDGPVTEASPLKETPPTVGEYWLANTVLLLTDYFNYSSACISIVLLWPLGHSVVGRRADMKMACIDWFLYSGRCSILLYFTSGQWPDTFYSCLVVY